MLRTIGLIIFYLGFFGFFVGLVGVIRGDLKNIKINNRKQSLMLVALSLLLILVGSQMVGPGESQGKVEQQNNVVTYLAKLE
ncbi:MAG: hypothetical protein WCR27_07195 [Eubacteriales bacterium]